MRPWEKEVLHVRRDHTGAITDVFEGNPNTYYKVVDTTIRIDPSGSDEPRDEVSSKFARLVAKGGGPI